jgi:hypothetical protein
MANPVSVEIYTSSHRILGRIQPGTAGLYGFMNDRTRLSIDVEGAHINRLHQPARLVARYPRLALNKKNIVALLLSNRNELGPVSMTRHGYSTVIAHPIHIMLPGFELRGFMEAPGRLDIGSVFVEGDTVFVPLFDGHFESILFPDIKASSPAVLFNSNRVTAMSLVPKTDSLA